MKFIQTKFKSDYNSLNDRRIVITSNPRKLSAHYTHECTQPVINLSSEDNLQLIHKWVREEIDKEILDAIRKKFSQAEPKKRKLV